MTKAGKLRRQKFAVEYLVDLNATQAAIRAGYAPKGAHVTGSRLLNEPKVAELIAAARAKLSDQAGITVKKVLEELGLVGFADMANYLTFGENGTVFLDWSQLPPGASRVISEVVQETRKEGRGDDAEDVTITRFKLHPKIPALNLIAQHLGMLIHRIGDPDGKPFPAAIPVYLVDPKE